MVIICSINVSGVVGSVDPLRIGNIRCSGLATAKVVHRGSTCGKCTKGSGIPNAVSENSTMVMLTGTLTGTTGSPMGGDAVIRATLGRCSGKGVMVRPRKSFAGLLTAGKFRDVTWWCLWSLGGLFLWEAFFVCSASFGSSAVFGSLVLSRGVGLAGVSVRGIVAASGEVFPRIGIKAWCGRSPTTPVVGIVGWGPGKVPGAGPVTMGVAF